MTLGSVAALALALAAAAAAPPAPADLPERVHLKTRTESFTSRHYVAVREGRLWFKANEETTGTREPWRLLPPDGLPHGKFRTPPADLREVSADGDNLVALGADGRVWYMKWSSREWTDKWGLPPVRSQLEAFQPNRGLAMSHRGPDNLYYEDIDGKRHPVDFGVTTFYALSADGRAIQYADPWLPPPFRYPVCPPLRGRFTAEALSASASTLFVVDASGAMHTRLADFDTVGDNPVLPYTWEPARRARQRRLPGEDWRAQPPVPGKITSRITILQTGQGNAARELRVEGVDAQGRGGYWSKAIFEADWRFVPTGAAVTGPFLANAANPGATPPADLLGPVLDRDFSGEAKLPGRRGRVPARLSGWNPPCTPLRLALQLPEGPLELVLHTRRAVPVPRPVGGLIFEAVLERPATTGPQAEKILARLFRKKRFLALHGRLAADGTLRVRGGAFDLRAKPVP